MTARERGPLRAIGLERPAQRSPQPGITPPTTLGALGLVVNAIALFNTRYMDRAIEHVRKGDRPSTITASNDFLRWFENILAARSILRSASLTRFAAGRYAHSPTPLPHRG